ncbi:23S rRNA (adenine(2503)-C(2))-methyltransferase RlmN [Pseudobacteriovorax antillogorgiicola]|uniref:Probable dual-specificity RNA methyltransferase RlmN n=1 Tax=Pseudobacteriovorax antillogorgiicola TaxID=1513793 RepID=A0A1Y6BCU2_9BACT|nr:23S rRNA (adenine(2503)-C(2))-methyltransferase RlmN [Pseudobacteriovorax antillogorgiicola]TCS58829.1 23S rRNA m(2)A-2503 methyltransferase [Pseudobacteriovorax antillogorgiicola]SME94190.1 23S rRNA m(2)A-2503 methyltransferase [Pseudobacteriovorax antillogorgiicola]
MEKQHFLSLTRQDYQDLMVSWGQPKFRAGQIADWIYKKNVRSPEEMSNLSKGLRDELFLKLDWSLPEVISKISSDDGSTKLLLRNQQGRSIETVILRYEGRTSLCVSSQVGCKLACDFCQTGKLGFVAHLQKYEILAQLYLANLFLKDEEKKISHVVFMGMGEPLDNYDNAVGAANMMIAESEFNLAARHVTISTSGIVPRIKQMAHETKASLALSLHASRDDLRTSIMPINRKYNLSKLKEALLYYQKETNRKITMEYILINQKNCGQREAKELVKFIHGLRAKVNLIPFNSHPGLPYQRPTGDEIRNFQQYLSDRSIPAPVRYSKGLDVSAACGQLAAKHRDELDQAPDRRRLVEGS